MGKREAAGEEGVAGMRDVGRRYDPRDWGDDLTPDEDRPEFRLPEPVGDMEAAENRAVENLNRRGS